MIEARSRMALLLLAAGTACGPAGRTVPSADRTVGPRSAAQAQASQAQTERMSHPIRSPGFRIPGSTVHLPGTAAPGASIVGRAPAGSEVEYLDRRLTVPENGRFTVEIPADAAQTLQVRIRRPGMTPLTLRIRIVER
jgi:hypothetical protein